MHRKKENKKKKKFDVLGPLETHTLLSMRAENPRRTLLDYKNELWEQHNIDVSTTFLHEWWQKRFHFRGSLRKPIFIPLDKWKIDNVNRFFEFLELIDQMEDRTRLNWLDEKHIVTSEVNEGKVRCDPLTGLPEAIAVSGDFRESHTVIAAI